MSCNMSGDKVYVIGVESGQDDCINHKLTFEDPGQEVTYVKW